MEEVKEITFNETINTNVFVKIEIAVYISKIKFKK